MAIQFNETYYQDINKPVPVRNCGTFVYNADNEANVINVVLMDGDEAAIPSGNVVCAVVCADGSTVPVTNGTISGNTVTVELNQACFAVPGQIGVGIQLVDGTTRATIYKGVYSIETFSTDNSVDPGSRVTLDISNLIDEIQTAVSSIPPDYSALTARVAALEDIVQIATVTEIRTELGYS